MRQANTSSYRHSLRNQYKPLHQGPKGWGSHKDTIKLKPISPKSLAKSLDGTITDIIDHSDADAQTKSQLKDLRNALYPNSNKAGKWKSQLDPTSKKSLTDLVNKDNQAGWAAKAMSALYGLDEHVRSHTDAPKSYYTQTDLKFLQKVIFAFPQLFKDIERGFIGDTVCLRPSHAFFKDSSTFLEELEKTSMRESDKLKLMKLLFIYIDKVGDDYLVSSTPTSLTLDPAQEEVFKQLATIRSKSPDSSEVGSVELKNGKLHCRSSLALFNELYNQIPPENLKTLFTMMDSDTGKPTLNPDTMLNFFKHVKTHPNTFPLYVGENDGLLKTNVSTLEEVEALKENLDLALGDEADSLLKSISNLHFNGQKYFISEQQGTKVTLTPLKASPKSVPYEQIRKVEPTHSNRSHRRSGRSGFSLGRVVKWGFIGLGFLATQVRADENCSFTLNPSFTGSDAFIESFTDPDNTDNACFHDADSNQAIIDCINGIGACHIGDFSKSQSSFFGTQYAVSAALSNTEANCGSASFSGSTDCEISEISHGGVNFATSDYSENPTGYPTPLPTTKSPTPLPTTISTTAQPTTISPTPLPTTKSTTAQPTTISPTPLPTTPLPTPLPTYKYTYSATFITGTTVKVETNDPAVDAVCFGESICGTRIPVTGGNVTFDICNYIQNYNGQTLGFQFESRDSDDEGSDFTIIDDSQTSSGSSCITSTAPSPAPSKAPSPAPTSTPTQVPVPAPSNQPTTFSPSSSPSNKPTTPSPTLQPTPNPTGSPTGSANSKDQGTSNWGVIGGSSAAGLTGLASLAMLVRRAIHRGAPVDVAVEVIEIV